MVSFHFARLSNPDGWCCFILQGLAIMMRGLLQFAMFGSPDEWFCFMLEG